MVISIVGSLAGVVTLLPRVTVEPSGPIEPLGSYLSFVITNTNVIPLENIKPMLGICFVSFAEEPQLWPVCKVKPGRIADVRWQISKLRMDEKYTISWEDTFASPPLYADISIVVSYNPWFLPWRLEKEFRFIARKQSDGKIHLFSRPIYD